MTCTKFNARIRLLPLGLAMALGAPRAALAIVDMLRESGVEIARRTVAKYREGMKIPSSVQRRREKRALANAGRQAS